MGDNENKKEITISGWITIPIVAVFAFCMWYAIWGAATWGFLRVLSIIGAVITGLPTLLVVCLLVDVIFFGPGRRKKFLAEVDQMNKQQEQPEENLKISYEQVDKMMQKIFDSNDTLLCNVATSRLVRTVVNPTDQSEGLMLEMEGNKYFVSCTFDIATPPVNLLNDVAKKMGIKNNQLSYIGIPPQALFLTALNNDCGIAIIDDSQIYYMPLANLLQLIDLQTESDN